jgi:hypothetical protein
VNFCDYITSRPSVSGGEQVTPQFSSVSIIPPMLHDILQSCYSQEADVTSRESVRSRVRVDHCVSAELWRCQYWSAYVAAAVT